MAVSRFEELEAWKRSRTLANQIYLSTKTGEFAKDYGFKDQICRAAVSVMSNIAEGFERGSRPDFHRFLVIAKASCAEVRSQLYLAKDVGYLDDGEFQKLMDIAEETARIIGGLRRSVEPK